MTTTAKPASADELAKSRELIVATRDRLDVLLRIVGTEPPFETDADVLIHRLAQDAIDKLCDHIDRWPGYWPSPDAVGSEGAEVRQ